MTVQNVKLSHEPITINVDKILNEILRPDVILPVLHRSLDPLITSCWVGLTSIIAFSICFNFGVVLSLIGSQALFLCEDGKGGKGGKGLKTFAIFYTLGNIVSVTGFYFLVVTFKRNETIIASNKILAAIVCVAIFMVVLTVISALFVKHQLLKAGLCFLCILLQLLAMALFGLAYIPYAGNIVRTLTEIVSQSQPVIGR